MRHSLFFSLVAAIPAAYGIAFPEPTAQNAGADRALEGISPVPTPAPLLGKRQQSVLAPLCGWVDGDFESAVTCSSSRTCMLYKSASIGMAGCCLGSDRQNCGWASSCVDYRSYTAGSCGSNCLINPFVLKCTNAAAPACITYTYEGGIRDYGCDSISTLYSVRSTASDSTARAGTTRSLSTVAAAAVTGINGNSGSTTNNGNSGTTNTDYTPAAKKAVKIGIGLIVGIVIAALVVIFLIVIGIVMFLKKKKKNQQLAQNAQIVAANQANRQSQYQQQPPPGPPPGVQSMPNMQQAPQPFIPPQPSMTPQQPAGLFSPPMAPQNPQPPANGYFPPAGAQKYEADSTVHEYAVTPISNPPTPAPAYSQPYAVPNAAPPMPQQPHGVVSPIMSPAQQYASPVIGAHEVDATSMSHNAQKPVVAQHMGAPQPSGPVYEMGSGK